MAARERQQWLEQARRPARTVVEILTSTWVAPILTVIIVSAPHDNAGADGSGQGALGG